jgi:hypothetical protein
MQRLLLLILLLAPACARRDVATGEWTGVARPDATVPQGGPVLDNGAPGTKAAVDAAPPALADASAAAGGEFAPVDAASGPRAVEAAPPPGEPVSPIADASTDSGDARSCPETGHCD